jgi:hypothetical protein
VAAQPVTGLAQATFRMRSVESHQRRHGRAVQLLMMLRALPAAVRGVKNEKE